MSELRTILRYARQDQYPPATDLRDAARDSVIRYANHFGLDFRWHHDQGCVLWQRRPGCGHEGCDNPGHYYWHQRLDIAVWRSEAIILPPA